MKLKYGLMLFILFTVTLTACNATSNPIDDGWREHAFQELGVTFILPSTWATTENENLISIATSQEILDSGLTPAAGASITMATAKDFDGFSDPQDILDLFMDYFEYGKADLERTNEPEVTTIQGIPATTVSYYGTVREQTGTFSATVISNRQNIALIFTFDSSETGEHAETFERFIQSVRVESNE